MHAPLQPREAVESSSAAVAAAAPRDALSLPMLLESYLSQSAAYDMGAKVCSNTLKLLLLYTAASPIRHSVFRSRAARLVDKILYFRMLINQVRYPGTFKGLFKSLSKSGNAEQWPVAIYAASILMFGFRVVEQLTGDFMYWHGLFPLLQRLTKKAELQWRYTFCKCWANLCTLLVELYKLRCMVAERRALEDELASAERSSCSDFAGSSPLGPGPVRLAGTRVWDELVDLRQKQLGSRIAVFRAMCEAFIYMRWAPWWHPPKESVAWLAVVSSTVGMWLVWHRTCEKVKRDERKRMHGEQVRYEIMRSEW